MVILAGMGFLGATVLLSVCLTWVVRRTALVVGLVDRPDGHRKLHGRITPLGGGVGVYLTTVAATAIAYFVPSPWQHSLSAHLAPLLTLCAACTVILLVGVADDFLRLRGRQKLLGQIVAALLIPLSGETIRQVSILGISVDLGILATPLTVIWLVGAINAVNLLDGIDGLATTLGIILSMAVGTMAAITGHPALAIVAFLFAASLAGFLMFNFPPATMFLGDAGSMLIGLTVGTLALQSSVKGAGTLCLAAPLVILTIPFLDSGAAILRRKLTGRSIYAADRGHLHHCLVQRLGNRKTLMWVGACAVFTSAAALVSETLRNDAIALLSAVTVVAIFVVTKLFGHSEMLLLVSRLRGFGRSLVKRRKTQGESQSIVRLQGTRSWELLWATLTEWAGNLGLRWIRLDVNAPKIGEGFHATWRASSPGEYERCWRMELPLLVEEHIVGQLSIIGDCRSPAAENLQQVFDLLEPFERHLQILTSSEEDSSSVVMPPVGVNAEGRPAAEEMAGTYGGHA